MPDWLSIPVGILLGCGIIFGAVYLAIRPYVAPRKPRSWMADSNGKRDDGEAWTEWHDNLPPPDSSL